MDINCFEKYLTVLTVLTNHLLLLFLLVESRYNNKQYLYIKLFCVYIIDWDTPQI